MRTLYLIRHGKSSWKYPELDDKQRPLKSRGENDAKLMAKLLHGKGIIPGLMISSPAVRAYHTACLFAEELGYDKRSIAKNDNLYFNGPSAILETLRQTGNEVNDVLVFGHNPDTLALVNNFAGTDFENVPTSGIACIQFNVANWQDISLQNGTFRWLDYPSLHKKD